MQHFQEELKSHQTAAQFKELKSKQTMGETSVTVAAEAKRPGLARQLTAKCRGAVAGATPGKHLPKLSPLGAGAGSG